MVKKIYKGSMQRARTVFIGFNIFVALLFSALLFLTEGADIWKAIIATLAVIATSAIFSLAIINLCKNKKIIKHIYLLEIWVYLLIILCIYFSICDLIMLIAGMIFLLELYLVRIQFTSESVELENYKIGRAIIFVLAAVFYFFLSI
ncbi:MAG: hypothetical protein ACRCUS_00400 [Anaerovoracaceae bacterium]